MVSKRRQRKGSLGSYLGNAKNRVITVFLIVGAVGLGYFLYQTFAAPQQVKYWGTLTKANPTASYKVTTGAGTMNLAFSNNTADLTLSVINSAKKVVGSVKSVGKRDVKLAVDVVPDVYTISLKSSVAFKTTSKKGYKILVNYPSEELTPDTKPTAVITKPLGNEEVKGIVDINALAQDDKAVTKVEFYVDATHLATDPTAPYAAAWDTSTVKDGVHTLSVKSYDASGNVGEASGIVTVKNTVAGNSRFPGDPNTKVTGRSYWGASGAHLAEHESATAKSVSVHRTFVSSWDKRSQLNTQIKTARDNNRLPWVSVKTPGWGTLASGSRDSEIDSMLRSMDSTANGKPVWFTVHHEFEGDTTTTGEFTRANFKAMNKKIRDRMDAVGTKNIAFMPIYVATSWGGQYNAEEWYVDGVWDAIAFDIYTNNASQSPLRDSYYKAVDWIAAKGLPYAVGEWGIRDYGDAAQSAKKMRDFWNWTFANKKDGIAFSYFDSPHNSPDGTWELDGLRRDTWRDILKNDSRVLRISDLSK